MNTKNETKRKLLKVQLLKENRPVIGKLRLKTLPRKRKPRKNNTMTAKKQNDPSREELVELLINEYLGRKTNATWDELHEAIEKVENSTNNGGIKHRTVLSTNELNGKDEFLRQYTFTIFFNQHPAYTNTAFSKKTAVILCLADYIKDRVAMKYLKKIQSL